MRGVWMLVDAVLFAVACAVLVSMPQAGRPQHALESVALSTALEDIALSASSQPDAVESACEGAAGESALMEKFRTAANAFAANRFFMHCPFGKAVSLSDAAVVPANSTASIFSNRVIVPKDGWAFLVLFEAQGAG